MYDPSDPANMGMDTHNSVDSLYAPPLITIKTIAITKTCQQHEPHH